MLNPVQSGVTLLLQKAQAGDEQASESFWWLVHGELRALAERLLHHERSNHTLPPTALVNEACLRLLGPDPLPWKNRAHFFGAAARAMRRILVDHARARDRKKRAGRFDELPLSEVRLDAEEHNVDLLALDEALDGLGRLDQRMLQVVELRFFAGMTVVEIARILGVSTGTVAGDWKIARMWLLQQIGKRDSHAS